MSERSSSPSRAGSPVTAVPELATARPFRFTWDPASRKPGPESVSGTTEGRADYVTANPRLPFLNTSLTNLALGAMPQEWSSSKHGFHAISTVLNNPHKKQAPPKAHSSLPAVPPADLPRVRRKDFESYIRVIKPEWDRFERNTQLGREGAPQLDDPTTPRASLVSGSENTPRSSSLPNPPGRSIPPLDSVPPVFFRPNFNLGDPHTFRTVTEQGNSADWNSIDPSALAHSLPLLEKFSHYADTVEQHLVQEISQRSSSFFAALTNLNELQSESEECLDRIGKLRGMLRDVDEKCAKKGLGIVRKELRMRNLGKAKEGVKFVVGIVEMTGVARGLVSAGQWGEALNVIDNMDSLWRTQSASEGEQQVESSRVNGSSAVLESISESLSEEDEITGRKLPNTVPLSSLHAFSSLPEHLRVLTLEIATSLTTELVGILRMDLFERIKSSSDTSKKTLNQSLSDRIKPLLQGLIRTKGVKDGILAWRDVALGEIRNIISQHIPGYNLDEDEPKVEPGAKSELRPGLGNHLREMSHTEYFHLLQAIFKSLLNGVEGLQAQSAVTLEVLESINSLTRALDSSEIAGIQEELSDILSSASELSNTRAAIVIAPRSEQHASLELPDFLALFDESWGFVVKCEVICRRMIVGLRGVVVSQAKTFLQAFHQVRLSRSAKLVEDEQWNPSEVPPNLQHIADILVDSAVNDAAELRLTPGEATAPGSTNGVANAPSEGESLKSPRANGAASAASKHLRIEDRTYFTVSATAEVLVLLQDYIRLVLNLPTLTTDAMNRVIEFLKAFNSRTCQVVLGAGAMRSAGLKNITAKHLALASQSLSIMIALIPYVRETFRRYLSSKQAVMLVEFDKLKRDYQEHQNEIHAKLIAIMGDRLTAHIKSLQAVDWNVPKQGGGVNDYMEILIKETVTLHKVLSRYLAIPVVEVGVCFSYLG
ncbi:hypothetical protein HGRIS_012937 [Hohenbuehelia grisea]|uniref:Vacuolar protein sorting-associated protein 54 C-terminal domain-containing protein n=1 Tax=Hohenbuehelia grisea TaxID=104357 RepID=A0ABR3ITZ8_9AGAR